MKLNNLILSVVLGTLIFPTTALAQPNVTMELTASKEVVVRENGQEMVKRVPVLDTAPGETIIYTFSYENKGNEPAIDVVINDPIPEETSYLPGSATGAGKISFSIDGGTTFAQPGQLLIEAQRPDGSPEKSAAPPELYTHIRWNVSEIPAGGKGELSFRVIVK